MVFALAILALSSQYFWRLVANNGVVETGTGRKVLSLFRKGLTCQSFVLRFLVSSAQGVGGGESSKSSTKSYIIWRISNGKSKKSGMLTF